MMRTWSLATAMLLALVSAWPTAGQAQEGSPFTIAIMPDVQGEANEGDPRMANRFQWLIGHEKELNLKVVLQVGDLMNFNNDNQYSHQSKALEMLDAADIPYVVTLGNHDTAAVLPDNGSAAPGNVNLNLRNTDRFNQHFAYDRFWLINGSYIPGRSENSYSLFRAGGLNWAVINLELWAQTPVIEWAKKVVESLPNYNVILLTHAYLNGDGSLGQNNGGYGDNSPQFIYDQLVKPYSNVKLIFSGHGGTHAYREDTTDTGAKTYAFLQCYHDSANPVRLMTIDTVNGSLKTWVYVPVNDKVLDDGSSREVTGIEWVKPR